MECNFVLLACLIRFDYCRSLSQRLHPQKLSSLWKGELGRGDSVSIEMSWTLKTFFSQSFPKYQSINKHEKQLIIHKASGTSVVIRAGWSGWRNAGDGNSSLAWTNLNGWKSQKSLKLEKMKLWSWQKLVICMQKVTEILQISCTKGTPSVTCKEFPCQLEPSEKGRDN